MDKKKRYKRNAYRETVREYVDSDYKERVPFDADGKPVESLRLNEEEKQYMYDFENEYYGNHHREGEIHSSHPDYDDRLKKSLDDSANNRGSDILTMNRYDRKIIKDLTNIANPAYNNELLSEQLKLKGLETTVKDLVKEALFDLKLTDNPQEKETLANLLIDVVRVIKMTQAADRKEKRR